MRKLIEILGYISGLLLAICALPQVIFCIKSGNAEGVSHLFIWFWFLGEIGMLSYTLIKFKVVGPLLINYILNIIFLLIIIRYLYFPLTFN